MEKYFLLLVLFFSFVIVNAQKHNALQPVTEDEFFSKPMVNEGGVISSTVPPSTGASHTNALDNFVNQINSGPRDNTPHYDGNQIDESGRFKHYTPGENNKDIHSNMDSASNTLYWIIGFLATALLFAVYFLLARKYRW